MPVPECNFCFAAETAPYTANCKECGFPIHGTSQEQAQFSVANADLKKVIDTAESALSNARFSLLWPWLTTLIGSGVYFLRPPANFLSFGILAALSLFFIAGYFVVAWKPVPVLLATTLVMLLIVGLAFWYLHSLSMNSLIPELIPLLITVVLARALYACYRVEKALDKKKFETIRL